MISHRDDLSEKAAILNICMCYIFSSKRGSVALWFISMPRLATTGPLPFISPSLPDGRGGRALQQQGQPNSRTEKPNRKKLTKTTISSALWVVGGRWPISDAPWTRPQHAQQATEFLENATPQHRTPRTSANDHLRTTSSLYTCPAIILAGAWQLTKTTISSAPASDRPLLPMPFFLTPPARTTSQSHHAGAA